MTVSVLNNKLKSWARAIRLYVKSLVRASCNPLGNNEK